MSEPDAPRWRTAFADKVAAAAAGVGEAIARTAGAAATLLTEQDLRKRGAQAIQGGIQGGVRGIQQSLQSGVNGIRQGLQTVGQGPRQLQSLLQRLSQQIEEQRMLILLQEQRDAPVDVQVGFQLYEDAPQELRSRLWMALLGHPGLVARYQALRRSEEREQGQDLEPAAAPAAEAWEQGREGEHEQEPAPEPAADASPPRPFPPGPAAEGEGQRTGGGEPAAAEAAGGEAAARPRPGVARGAPPPAAGGEDAAGGEEAQPAAAAPVVGDSGWELVGAGSRRRQGQPLLAAASQAHKPPRSPEREAYRNDLMAAMAAVPWPLPTGHPEECRYATLLQISIGQEEVDEVITRDIHRTFPEHPLFAFEQGQQALFRVLKAYSLHDLEVNYCQGMAFLAGLLLFFVSEDAAFQILCRLLCAAGPNLRRLYLPGLAGLKVELRKLDWLMARHLPNLKAHLEAHGAVPVLFASQWFLTCFSCPFPVSFACRLVDVMLAENGDAVLQRAALAVMAECEGELLVRDDFEELLTYLKVGPMQWGPHRLRRVLNAAVASPVTEAELREAEAAAEGDPHPLLSGLEVGSGEGGGEGGAGREGRLPDDIQSAVGGVDGVVLGQLAADAAPRGAHREESPSSAPAACGAVAAAAGGAGDDPDARLAQQRDELDSAFVQMVLDLDHAWGGEDESAGEAYEHALTQPSPLPPQRAGAGSSGDQGGQRA